MVGRRRNEEGGQHFKQSSTDRDWVREGTWPLHTATNYARGQRLRMRKLPSSQAVCRLWGWVHTLQMAKQQREMVIISVSKAHVLEVHLTVSSSFSTKVISSLWKSGNFSLGISSHHWKLSSWWTPWNHNAARKSTLNKCAPNECDRLEQQGCAPL